MRRLAGALALVHIIVALAAATLTTPAAAHRHAYARVKCVGLYCAIVSVPRPGLRQGYGRRPASPAVTSGRRIDGRAPVYDANSGGHFRRVQVRSPRGYSIRNPHGR